MMRKFVIAMAAAAAIMAGSTIDVSARGGGGRRMLDPCVDALGLAVDFGLLLTAQDQVAYCDPVPRGTGLFSLAQILLGSPGSSVPERAARGNIAANPARRGARPCPRPPP